jgi:cell division septation protein DedD
MSESNFREIQLNTKQVVFLFMACVVALLGVFLLGVQVGHGVSNNDGTTAAAAGASDAANDAAPPTVLPPATSPKADDFGYDRELRGKGEGKAPPTTPPNPSADGPPDSTAARKSSATPTPKPPAPAVAAPAGTDKAASATAVWFVQIDSFSSKGNAQKQVDLLKTKGHQATVFTAPGGGARFKTRIGPMERNAADALKNRLAREGFRPSVIK